MTKGTEQSAASIKLSLLIVVLIAVFFLSFLIGRYPIAPDIALGILLSKIVHLTPFWTEDMEIVMLKIRLPRIMAAILVGAALAASGAAYQGLFRNPLVSPGILGVTAGASFGAALAILLSLNAVGVQVAAFAFGLAAVTATYLITLWLGQKGETILLMILAGIIIGTLFTAFVSLIKYVADPNDALPAITYWLMGSLAAVNNRDVYLAAVPIGTGLFVLTLLRWNLNVMSFGEEEARALGVNTVRLRIIVVVCATMVTASAVAISGVIGLVGLVVPHLSRLLVGPNYKSLLPAAIVMGSIFMLLVDNLARTLFAVEVPLGILTSLIGAPFFLYLLLHTRKGWA